MVILAQWRDGLVTGRPNNETPVYEDEKTIKLSFFHAILYACQLWNYFSVVKQYRHLVLWLENNKIQHYDVKEREGLMAVNDDNKWNAAFMRYLKDQVSIL